MVQAQYYCRCKEQSGLAGAGGLERDSNGALSVKKNILCANKQLLLNYEQSKRLRNDLGQANRKLG